MDFAFAIAEWTIGLALAAAAIMSLIRIIRGPSIVDRMAGSDTFVTLLIVALIADMVLHGHTHTLPLVIALAMTASIGTIAVARYVSHGRPRADADEGAPSASDGRHPDATRTGAER